MKNFTFLGFLLAIALSLAGQPKFSVSQTNKVESQKATSSFYLPFFENWSSMSFETNNWTTSSENWKINTTIGNERPSVEFDWSPLLENDYSSTLESNTINAEDLFVGRIFLDFDLMLNNRNATGTEKLLVEVFDGEAWHQVYEISNNSSLDWDRYSVEITEQALGTNFKFRFNAAGQSSFDIIGWYLDNIELYRACDSPYGLDGEMIWYGQNDVGAEIWWNAPESAVYKEFEWLHWDDGSNHTAIGTTNNETYSVAARWDEIQLEEYVGDTLKEIKFFLKDYGYDTIVVNVWKGSAPPVLCYQKIQANPVPSSWNTHMLDTVLILEPETEYRFGYSIINPSNSPVGVDDGPAVKGFGDLFYSSGEWDNLSDFGLNYNFNIQIKLTNSDSNNVNCQGFNIYRTIEYSNDFEYYDFVMFEEGISDFSFFEDNLQWNHDYCYKVNAVWGESGDTCISDFGITVVPIYDFVCVFTDIGIDEFNDSKMTLSPNPTNTNLLLQSETVMTDLAIFGVNGSVIYSEKIPATKNYQIDVCKFTPGLYFLKVITERGVATRKFVKSE